MRHPEILLLPVLMFSDYFLTVWGAVLRERKHSEHFKLENYELNPIWQKEVRRKKRFNPRHILITVLVSAGLGILLQLDDTPDFLAEALCGCLFTVYGAVIGRHLNNIFVFRQMARKPQNIAGQVKMDHSLILAISMYQYLVVAVPVLIIALFTRTAFCAGAVWGVGMLFLMHVIWIRKNRRRAKVPPPIPEAAAK